jgi:hypothetical protein
MSKNSLTTIIVSILIATATFGYSAPVAHASTLGNTLISTFGGFHFSSIRSLFQEKIQAGKKEIQAGKENAAKNRDERNAMLAAQTNTTASSTTNGVINGTVSSTDPIRLLTVSWTSLKNIESWMAATTTAAQANSADVSEIQPLLNSAQNELDQASSSINILTSSSTTVEETNVVMGTATSSLDIAKTDLQQALELLKTIVNN